MNSSEQLCARTMTLLRDMYVHNEKMSSDDAAFLKQHIACCDRCLADSAILRGVSAPSISDACHNFSGERTANEVLRRLRVEADNPGRRFGTGRSVQIWAASALAAAMIVFGFLIFSGIFQETSDPAPSRVTTVEAHKSQKNNSSDAVPVAVMPGSKSTSTDLAEVESREAKKFYTAATEKRLLLPDGIKLLLAPQTRVSILSSKAQGTSVFLSQGKLLASVDPDRDRPSFRVAIAEGEIHVTGTIFSVTASRAMIPHVEVLRGHVNVIDRRNRVRAVSAGERLLMHSGMLEAIADSERIKLATSSERLEQSIDIESEVVDLNGAHSQGTVAANVLETITPPPSIRRQLIDVRKYRSLQQWGKVIDVYQEIILHHPGSSTASEALVAIGDIQLTKFHNPQKALHHFNQYLSGSDGFSLAEEALIGKAKALKLMNRFNEEYEVLQNLKNRYPNSVYTTYVEKRLAEIMPSEKE